VNPQRRFELVAGKSIGAPECFARPHRSLPLNSPVDAVNGYPTDNDLFGQIERDFSQGNFKEIYLP
jgi:hypothetical protein